MESKQKAAEKVAKLSYEECYARLQTVLERLEAADLPLADSLDLYETGMVLAARLRRPARRGRTAGQAVAAGRNGHRVKRRPGSLDRCSYLVSVPSSGYP